jgi:hypothetical protein
MEVISAQTVSDCQWNEACSVLSRMIQRLRDRKRGALMHNMQATALDLFKERGFT